MNIDKYYFRVSHTISIWQLAWSLMISQCFMCAWLMAHQLCSQRYVPEFPPERIINLIQGDFSEPFFNGDQYHFATCWGCEWHGHQERNHCDCWWWLSWQKYLVYIVVGIDLRLPEPRGFVTAMLLSLYTDFPICSFPIVQIAVCYQSGLFQVDASLCFPPKCIVSMLSMQ